MSETPSIQQTLTALVRETYANAQAAGHLACPRVLIDVVNDLPAAFLLQHLCAWGLEQGALDTWQTLTREQASTTLGIHADEFVSALALLHKLEVLELGEPHGAGRRVRVRLQPLLAALERYLQEQQGGAA